MAIPTFVWPYILLTEHNWHCYRVLDQCRLHARALIDWLCLGLVDWARYGHFVPHHRPHNLGFGSRQYQSVHVCGSGKEALTVHSIYLKYISYANLLHRYPIIYNFCILPNSIARWLSFTNHSVPDRIVLAANAIHALSGFFDLIVFSITRPAMVFGTRDTPQQIHVNHCGFPSRAVARNKRPPQTLDTPDFSPISSQHDTFDHSLHTRRPVMSGSEV